MGLGPGIDVPAFPVEALPERVRTFVEEVSASRGYAPEVVASMVLATCAGAAGGTHRMQIRPGESEALVLWATPIVFDDHDMRPLHKLIVSPLTKRQSSATADYREEMRMYQYDIRRYQKEYAKYEKLLNSKHFDRQRITDAEPGDPPERPVAQRFILEEQELLLLASAISGNDRGTLLARSHVDRWIRNLQSGVTEQKRDWEIWRAIHDAEAISVDDPTNPDKPVGAHPYAAMSVMGAVTCESLGGDSHTQQSVSNLLLLTRVRRNPISDDARLTPKASKGYSDLIAALADLSHEGNDPDTNIPGPLNVPFSQSAQAAWNSWTSQLDDSILRRDAGRLSLLIHLVTHCRTRTDGLSVDEPSLQSGITLAQWFAGERRAITQQIANDWKKVRRLELVRYVAAAGGVTSVRSLMRQGPRYASADRAREALNDLAAHNLGIWVDLDTTPKFRVHPVAPVAPVAASQVVVNDS